MSNDYLNIKVESDYEYFSDESITSKITSDALNFKAYFEQGDWLDSELETIRTELVETAKMFARNQGLSDTYTVKIDKSKKLRINTGNLIKSIKAEPLRGTKGIRFYNDAKYEDRGELYAGHIEYGFHDRGGNFIPARPFMRPALYAVAEGSKGNFQDILKGLIQELWKDGGFQGVSSLSFGRKSQHRGSNFWSSSKNFSESLSKQKDIKKLTHLNNRRKMSLPKKDPENKRGFRLKENRQEHQRLLSSRKNRNKKGRARSISKKEKKPKQQKQQKQQKQEKKQEKPKMSDKDKRKHLLMIFRRG